VNSQARCLRPCRLQQLSLLLLCCCSLHAAAGHQDLQECLLLHCCLLHLRSPAAEAQLGFLLVYSAAGPDQDQHNNINNNR
jgi:hypothetical protein